MLWSQEAREWLAALDAASLELAKAQSSSEGAEDDEATQGKQQIPGKISQKHSAQAVAEAAEYLREVEVALQK